MRIEDVRMTETTKAPRALRKKDLSYGSYLELGSLLDLQHPQSEPAHHDEMLFIIIHQTYELWFKLVLHELENAQRYLNEDNVLRAHHFIKRVVEILRVGVQQIHILSTMAPVEFLQFRDRLNPASGFQSYQFREVEYLCGLKDPSYLRFFKTRPNVQAILQARLDKPDVRDAFYGLLRRRWEAIPDDISMAKLADEEPSKAVISVLRPLYQNPEADPQLYLLAESLIDLDENLGLFREHHVRVVERIIGAKTGTGGSSGVGYLRTTTSKKCFPWVWEVRSHLTKE